VNRDGLVLPGVQFSIIKHGYSLPHNAHSQKAKRDANAKNLPTCRGLLESAP
jgi:hypothetical protein